MFEDAKVALQKIFERYKSKGLLTVYLWGSIVSSDFNPETSDVDSIGLAESSFSLEYEKEIVDMLTAIYPYKNKFGFRILYIDEFNGSEPKSNLAKFIPLGILLQDSPAWIQVAGEKFSQADFKLRVPTREEVLKLQLTAINVKFGMIKHPSDAQYVVKAIARLVDAAQAQRPSGVPFSYKALKERTSLKGERKVIDAILECKGSGWNFEVFQRNLPIFTEYITKLKYELNLTPQ